MTAKLITLDGEARRALERGIDRVAKAVKITLGPKGRNVVLAKGWGAPTITNDGVSIASQIDLEEPQENIGAQLVKLRDITEGTPVGRGFSTRWSRSRFYHSGGRT